MITALNHQIIKFIWRDNNLANLTQWWLALIIKMFNALKRFSFFLYFSREGLGPLPVGMLLHLNTLELSRRWGAVVYLYKVSCDEMKMYIDILLETISGREFQKWTFTTGIQCIISSSLGLYKQWIFFIFWFVLESYVNCPMTEYYLWENYMWNAHYIESIIYIYIYNEKKYLKNTKSL